MSQKNNLVKSSSDAFGYIKTNKIYSGIGIYELFLNDCYLPKKAGMD
jgi:hypothetical protein